MDFVRKNTPVKVRGSQQKTTVYLRIRHYILPSENFKVVFERLKVFSLRKNGKKWTPSAILRNLGQGGEGLPPSERIRSIAGSRLPEAAFLREALSPCPAFPSSPGACVSGGNQSWGVRRFDKKKRHAKNSVHYAMQINICLRITTKHSTFKRLYVVS